MDTVTLTLPGHAWYELIDVWLDTHAKWYPDAVAAADEARRHRREHGPDAPFPFTVARGTAEEIAAYLAQARDWRADWAYLIPVADTVAAQVAARWPTP